MRVRAATTEVILAVEADGLEAARQHGWLAPADYEGAGDRIVTNVPLPAGAVAVEGGIVTPGAFPFAVQAVRWRSRGWQAVTHRLVQAPDRLAIIAASPWTPGPWEGESVVSREFDPGLPPEANPA